MIHPGEIVISKAGRDKGRNLIILKQLDEKHLLLVDGDLRPLDKPKKKKIIHLQKTNRRTDRLEEAVETKNNKLLRDEIKRLMPRKESRNIV